MPLPKAKQNPMKSDFFRKPGKDAEAIVRVIRPTADDPLVWTYCAHDLNLEDPEADSGKRFVRAYCLASPQDLAAPVPDEAGAARCATIGPIGESGVFLHEFDWQWYFTCFLYVHAFEGVMVNRVQIFTYRQGSPTKGVYTQLAEALDNAEDQNYKMSDVLLRIKGVAVSPSKPNQVTPTISYIGLPQGKYAEYDMTSRMKAEAVERMGELRDKWDPRMSEADLRKLLCVGPAEPEEPNPLEGPGEYDSGLDGHPRAEDELP